MPTISQVISALVQDAVFPVTEMTWQPRGAPLCAAAQPVPLGRCAGAAERAAARLSGCSRCWSFDDVTSVPSQGIDRGDTDMVLSLLSIAFEPGEDGTGRVSC